MQLLQKEQSWVTSLRHLFVQHEFETGDRFKPLEETEEEAFWGQEGEAREEMPTLRGKECKGAWEGVGAVLVVLGRRRRKKDWGMCGGMGHYLDKELVGEGWLQGGTLDEGPTGGGKQ